MAIENENVVVRCFGGYKGENPVPVSAGSAVSTEWSRTF